MEIKKILLSRTDNIGDVVLTLPTAGLLKKYFPDTEVYFLGKSYTKQIIEVCEHIDGFLDRDALLKRKGGIKKLKSFKFDAVIHIFPDKEIAKLASKAGVPLRIGTNHRLFHLLYCNKLVNLGRKKSSLHEAVLNMKLLKPLGIEQLPDISEIPGLYGLNARAGIKKSQKEDERFKIILHPKSKGSAREWPLEKYSTLIKLLPKEQFRFYITGTREEGEKMREEYPALFEQAEDVTGKFDLSGLIDFIASADGFVSCSTGPLHIAAALGKSAVGIYPPMRPIHPGRWAPLGKNATYLVADKPGCKLCKKTKVCSCIAEIEAEQVKNCLEKAFWEVNSVSI